MNLYLSTLFLLLLVIPASAGELPDPTFHKLEVEALGVNKAIHQAWDSRGRLWSVTDKGLMRYDGYKSVLILPEKGNENTPLSDQLRTLWKVSENEFWLTYKDRNDISKFDPVTNQYNHFFTNTANIHSLPNVEIAKIIVENDSIRWLLTWGKGICRFNITNGFATCYANDNKEISTGEPPVNFTKDMVKLDDDKYLASFFYESTFATPYYFIPSSGKFIPLDLDPFLKKHDERMAYLIRLALTMTNFIYDDPYGNLWFGTYIGLIRVNLEEQTMTRVSVSENDLYRQNLENTRSYVTDKNGLLWIGTPNQGILLVNPQTSEASYLRHNVSSDGSLSDDRVTSVARDPFNNIWLATESGTFSICNPLSQNFVIHPWSIMNLDFSDRSFQQIPVNQILVLEDGRILISNATGLIEYNTHTRESHKILSPKSVEETQGELKTAGIYHFSRRGDDIYFMTLQYKKKNLPTRYNLKTQKQTFFEPFFSSSRLLFRHADSLAPIVFTSWWKGTSIGVFNPVTEVIDSLTKIPDSLTIHESFTLMLNSGKWMFPFYQESFGILDPATGNLEVYHRNSPTHFFPDSSITCAYKEPSGTVWIGTQTAIYQFNEATGEMTRFNEQAGLDEKERVNVITQDRNGVFWICLNKDMIRWDRKKGTAFRFNKSHGLNPGTFLPAVAQFDSSGTMYIACYNGILVLNPDKVLTPDYKPVLHLASAMLFNQALDPESLQDAPNEFTYDENYFTFEFHTDEVFTLTPNIFYYRLVGRDKDWQDNGISNRIRLADLGPGEYTLEVKAVNAFGNESNTLQITFIIAKPFWLTWWFIGLIILMLAVAVWIYIRYREKALRKRGMELERIVHERTADVVREKKEADKQRLEAEHQKEIVEEKQKEISDSINYAKRIQNAILPSNRFFKSSLPDSFVLYLPKDIVAGDFYFMETVQDIIIVAVADCTGHGVPGAMVSVVCHNALTRSVKEFGLTRPHEILDKTRELVLETFEKSEDQVNDGMDIALCCINRKMNTLFFAGANNGLFLIRKNELLEFKPDKQPIGKFIHARPFAETTVALEKGDQFYLFSDGYADQFGGEEGKPGGKKFKYSRLKALLQEIHLKKQEEQHDILAETLVRWRGELEQVDDVCIIGFLLD